MWPYGISGDLPIAALTLAGAEEAETALPWLGVHKLLSRSGYAFDLAILLDEGGDYRRPAHSRLAEGLRAIGWDHMAGAKGGVHLLAAAPPVLEAAAVRLGAAWPPYVPPDAEPERSFALEKGLPLWEAGADGSCSRVPDRHPLPQPAGRHSRQDVRAGQERRPLSPPFQHLPSCLFSRFAVY